MTSGSPRILLVRLGALGDVVHAMPAAAALRRAHPDARIDWLIDPRYADLAGRLRGLDGVIPIDPRGPRRAFLATVAGLRAAAYDAAVDFQGLVKSAVLARASRARRVIGFPRAHLREPIARAFYTQTVDPGTAAHVIHKNLALAAALGADPSRVEFPLRDAVDESPAWRPFVDRPYLLVNPGAAWPNKRWPPLQFGRVAAALAHRASLTPLVLWGPGEAPLAQAVADASDGTARVLPATGLSDILALARGARLMISGDTGPLHLAGAVGTPIVSIFGPTRADRNGPWNPADIALSRFDGCGCHYERRCRRGTPCIDSVSVDEVVEAALRRMGADG